MAATSTTSISAPASNGLTIATGNQVAPTASATASDGRIAAQSGSRRRANSP